MEPPAAKKPKMSHAEAARQPRAAHLVQALGRAEVAEGAVGGGDEGGGEQDCRVPQPRDPKPEPEHSVVFEVPPAGAVVGYNRFFGAVGRAGVGGAEDGDAAYKAEE